MTSSSWRPPHPASGLQPGGSYMAENAGRAIVELAEKYGRSVLATAQRILGNLHDAEDVLQDVFLRLFREWNRNVHPERIANWGACLRAMASRTALDALRSKKRRRETMVLEDAADARQSDGQAAVLAEQSQRLRNALAALPPRDAQVFSLRYFEELSYETIAATTGLSVDLVGVILHRSRARLRSLFAEADGEHRSSRSC